MASVRCASMQADRPGSETGMSEITVSADCGGAPAKALLRDLNIAFDKADVEGILAYFSDDIRWQIMGADDLRGKTAVREALEAMKDVVTRELVIDSIIAQAREGSISGVITTEQRLLRRLPIRGGRWVFD